VDTLELSSGFALYYVGRRWRARDPAFFKSAKRTENQIVLRRNAVLCRQALVLTRNSAIAHLSTVAVLPRFAVCHRKSF
jgi:hypothetical protein